jgi:hypothetical protein
MKIRDITARAKGKVRDWNTSEVTDTTVVPRTPEVAKEVVGNAAERVEARVQDVKAFRWLNPGLNRAEKRKLRHFLKRSHKLKQTPALAVQRGYAKFQLENTPKNIPATRDGNGNLKCNNPIYASFAQARGVQVVQ